MTKKTKTAASRKRRSHGKVGGAGVIGSLFTPAAHIAKRREAEAREAERDGVMDRPYVAVVLRSNSERTRSTYRTADEAFAHARDKIGEIARTQGGQSLQFAICKVVEIVEATTPLVARRAPKRGDGTAEQQPRYITMFDELFTPTRELQFVGRNAAMEEFRGKK